MYDDYFQYYIHLRAYCNVFGNNFINKCGRIFHYKGSQMKNICKTCSKCGVNFIRL